MAVMNRIAASLPKESVRQPHFELTKNIELVIRSTEDGRIIARTGIMVSPIESDHLNEYSGIESVFLMGFAPAVGVRTPPGCYWSEEQQCWVGKREESPATSEN